MSKPFFSMLHKWLFSGELNDPFSEFFVAVDPDLVHVQYVQQSANGRLAGDGGFAGLAGDADEINVRSIGSPVSFDMAMARAAPALLDRKSPAPTLFWISSSEGRGVDGLVPG